MSQQSTNKFQSLNQPFNTSCRSLMNQGQNIDLITVMIMQWENSGVEREWQVIWVRLFYQVNKATCKTWTLDRSQLNNIVYASTCRYRLPTWICACYTCSYIHTSMLSSPFLLMHVSFLFKDENITTGIDQKLQKDENLLTKLSQGNSANFEPCTASSV